MAGLGRRSHYRKHITDSVLNTCPEPGEGERIAKVVGTRGSNQFEIILSDTKSTCRGTVTSTKGTTNSGSEKVGQRWGQQPQPQPQYHPPHQPSIVSSARTSKLAILPTKYRKLVWVKRNDFVIVRCGQDDDEDAPPSENEKEGNTMDRQEPSGVEEKVDEATSSRGTAAIISGIRYEISHILYKDQVKHLQRKGLWPDDDPLFSGEGVAVGSGAAMENDSSATNKKDEEEQEKDHDSYDGGGGDGDGIVYDADDLLFVNTNKISTMLIDSESESDSDSDAGI